MTSDHDRTDKAAKAMADLFGPLSLTMLTATELSPAWRINFLANFFTGPFYRALAESHGLSRAEFVILLGLSQQPNLLARDICLATGLPKNSISRAVSDLLQRLLISAETEAEDRRVRRLTLTPSGAAILAEVLPMVETRQSAMRAALDPDEAATFDQLLLKLIAAMPEWVETR